MSTMDAEDKNNTTIRINNYSYKEVIMIIEHFCRLFNITEIESVLLDFIAMYSSYVYAKIFATIESKILYHFQVFVELNGFTNYFTNHNDIIALWSKQYIQLKLAQIGSSNNEVILQCENIKQNVNIYGDNTESFIISTTIPSQLREIYKIKGELDNTVCWLEFRLIKKQNNGLCVRSNKFNFCYMYNPHIHQANESLECIYRMRRHRMDAAIVRIMKAHKPMAMKLDDVTNAVIKQLKHRFTPKRVDIKKRIANLIELEYLESDENDKWLCHYKES
eukprot:186278_1